MSPRRRALLGAFAMNALGGESAAAAPAQAAGPAALQSIRRGKAMAFPRDHGAHVDVRIEWWYVTGWLEPSSQSSATPSRPSSSPAASPATSPAAAPPTPTHGFQITFFRSRVGTTDAARPNDPLAPPGRFAPRHLLFAHAAVTDLAAGRHHHAQRIARWNGEPTAGPDRAAVADADIRLARWRLSRENATAEVTPSRWFADVPADGFSLRATLRETQSPLLQGEAGFSRKGPEESQASLYYSLPQLDTELTLELNGQRQSLHGRAWLDHEWSETLLHPLAVGWDWIGINLFDGSAFTAFQLRRADGSARWAGGSFRAAGAGATAVATPRIFAPGEVLFSPGRRWRSPATNAAYPMTWLVRTPAGTHTVRALLDAQELDSRGGTGAVYWEGLAEWLDEGGQRIGLGYLEMTGYAAPIKLG